MHRREVKIINLVEEYLQTKKKKNQNERSGYVRTENKKIKGEEDEAYHIFFMSTEV